MKYYIRLIKNKGYKLIIVSLIILFLGLFISYISILKVNFFLLICGILNVYFGLVFFPVTSKKSQDMTEFNIDTDDLFIYIEFRKYKWKIKRENFSGGASLMFFDDSRHFVTLLRASQVYNAVYDMDKIKRNLELSAKNQIHLVPDPEKLSIQEKTLFCQKFKLNKSQWIIKVFSLFCLIIGISFFGIFNQIETKSILKEIAGVIFGLLLGIVFLYFAYILFLLSLKGKREYRYIIKNEMFKVRVYCHDKLMGDDSNTFYIKISDGYNLFFDEYYRVTKEQFLNANQLKWYAYYYKEKKGSYKIRILEHD